MVEQEPLLCADSSLLPGKAPPGLFILHEWDAHQGYQQRNQTGRFFCCRYKQKESNRNMWGNKGHPRLFQRGFSVEIVSKNMTGVLCWCRRYHLLSLGLCISITQAVMNHSPGTLSLGLTWVSKPGIPSVFCHGAPYKYWGGKSPKSRHTNVRNGSRRTGISNGDLSEKWQPPRDRRPVFVFSGLLSLSSD